MAKLTAARLREVLDYAQETGRFSWRRQVNGSAKIGATAGWNNAKGYLRITIDGSHYMAHRLAWLYVHGQWPANQIDHINCDKKDNRIANLREATRSENMQNQRFAQKHNASGFLGVCRCGRKWRALIRVGNRSTHIGLFDTPEEAHAAYMVAKRKIHPTAPVIESTPVAARRALATNGRKEGEGK